MKTPLVGITPRLQKKDNILIQVNYNYIIPMVERNLNHIILPLESPLLEDILNLCDAFLVIGGDDINPNLYGEINAGLSKGIDDRLDSIDAKVIKHAIKSKKPLLGICRGLQSIAVFCGGSLYQDIDTAHLKHDNFDKKHLVNTIKITKLTKQLPKTFLVNTYHHQAINKIPLNFDVIFQHQDIIEGIEHQTLPIFGIQWHPERIKSPESIIIFDYFNSLIRAKNGD